MSGRGKGSSVPDLFGQGGKLQERRWKFHSGDDCGDNPSLVDFQKSLLKELILHGLRCKGNPKFNPHLTLSRGAREEVKQPVEPIDWMVGEIVLVQSVIGQGRHIHLGKWQLAPSF